MNRRGRPISPSTDVRAMDQALIHEVGIPSAVLMEHAGHGLALALAAWWGERPPPETLILCGPGNNGGDGLVAARHLALWGYPVSVCYPRRPASPPPLSPDRAPKPGRPPCSGF